MELRNPKVVENFIIYQYHHLDDHTFMLNAQTVLGDFETYEQLAHKVSEKFRSAGWEGDGKLKLMWFPPFVGAGMEDTYGWAFGMSNNPTTAHHG